VSLAGFLLLVHDGVEHFQERRTERAAGVGLRAAVVGLNNGNIRVGRGARAALVAVVFVASRLLALQLALGTSTVGGLHALVGAVEFLAHGRAFRFGSSAGGVALSGCANSLALGAVFLLTIVLGAADRAGGAFAVNNALGALSLLTLHFTLGTSTHWVADSRAGRVIALPAALRVALFSRNNSNKEQETGEAHCCPCSSSN